MGNLLFDIFHVVRMLAAVTPAQKTATFQSAIIDTQNFNSLGFAIHVGTISALSAVNRFDIKVESGNDSGLADAADIDVSDYIVQANEDGSAWNRQLDDLTVADTVMRLGINIRDKRFFRLEGTEAAVADAVIAVEAALAGGLHKPV